MPIYNLIPEITKNIFPMHAIKRTIFYYILSIISVSGQLNGMNLSRSPLVPQPQKIEFQKAAFALPSIIKIYSSESAGDFSKLIIAEINKYYPQIKATTTNIPGKSTIRLHIKKNSSDNSDEGYSLKIDHEGIDISAKTPNGIFYGIQTLNSLISASEKQVVPCCNIKDWPSLQVRGAYFNIINMSSSGIPYLKKLISLMANLKMNTIVLEFGDNFPFKKQKFNRKEVLTRAEIKDIVRYAQKRYIKVIPYMQALSHVRWLSRHPDYLSLVEKPSQAKSWGVTWCPSNPKLTQIISDIIEETTNLIKPEYFHIGLDEIGHGAFHICSKCRQKNAVTLFENHIEKLLNIIKNNGATPIVYHDGFLPPELVPNMGAGSYGNKYLNKMPRETVINIWDYNRTPSVKIINYYNSKGFNILGASWFRQMLNCQTLPQEIAKLGSSGIGNILTFWYYMPNYGITEWRQLGHLCFPGIVLTANYSWNVNATPLKNIPYDPTFEARKRLKEAPAILSGKDHYTPVPLKNVVNYEINCDQKFPIFTQIQLEKLKNELSSNQEKFQLLTNNKSTYYGVSPVKTKGSITFGINGKTKSLSFMFALPVPSNIESFQRPFSVRKTPEIGSVIITYADNKKVRIPLRYHWNIVEWNAQYGGFKSRFVNRTVDSQKRLVQFSVLDWKNIRKDSKIRTITINASQFDNYHPVLLALSAYDFKDCNSVCGANTKTAINKFKKVTVKQHQTKSNAIEISDFSKASKMRFSVDNAYIALPTVNVAKTPLKQRILNIDIPPAKSKGKRGRVKLDFPMKNCETLKAVEFDIWISDSSSVIESGLYLGNDKYKKHTVKYGFTKKCKSKKWRKIVINLNSMWGKIKTNEISTMRISFWTNNIKPLSIMITPPKWLDNSVDKYIYKHFIDD